MENQWWVPDENEVWLLATAQGGDLPNGCLNFVVNSTKKSLVKAKSSCVPMIPYADGKSTPEDLIFLPEVNSASILDVAQQRFLQKKIYSSCGAVVMSINPFGSFFAFSL